MRPSFYSKQQAHYIILDLNFTRLLKIKQHKELISYAIVLVVLLLFLRFVEYKFLLVRHQFEIYIIIIAVLFLIFGIWIANKITKPKIETIVIEKEIIAAAEDFVINEKEILERKISKRELEVLHLMAKGLSNQEIAETLFVSLNTVKTHSSNLLEKLEAKRRTQAIENAKRMNIII